jgi:hypothetical protein
MARVLALTRDLLFGSRVQGALTLAGHEVELLTDEPCVRERLADSPDGSSAAVDVLVVDLTDAELRGEAIVGSLARAGLLGGVQTLGFYSHVEDSVRARAQAAGFDLVVARSRMAREGAELVTRLAGAQAP